jgi:hypothetical protein
VLVSWAALITYFYLVPRWPDLRDSGVPSVALAVLGATASAFGLWRSFAAGRRRRGWLLLALAVLPAAFLALYIFVFSYRLPPPERAVAVGAQAPALELPDQFGKPRTLADFAGRWLILDFFRGPW